MQVIDNGTFRIPGATSERLGEVRVEGTRGYGDDKDFCVIADPSKPRSLEIKNLD